MVAELSSRSSLWKDGRPQAPFHGIRHRFTDRGTALPLKLCPPRAGKSPNWTIRGSYLGIRVDQTTGTADGKLARKVLAKVKGDIERGAFSRPGAPTFAAAALRYVESGADERFILKLADHFGEMPLARIDQAAIDAAAIALYPRATPATRNRQVYSPMSAILKAAGVADRLKRPKGGRGAKRLFLPNAGPGRAFAGRRRGHGRGIRAVPRVPALYRMQAIRRPRGGPCRYEPCRVLDLPAAHKERGTETCAFAAGPRCCACLPSAWP